MEHDFSTIWQLDSDYRTEHVPSFGGKVWKISDSRGVYFLKQKCHKAQAENEHKLLLFLNSQRLPVACPLPDREGNLISSYNGNSYSLYPRLCGGVIEDHYEDPNTGFMYGKAISVLHEALSTYSSDQNSAPMLPSSNLDSYVMPKIAENKKEFQYERLMETIGLAKPGILQLDTFPSQCIHRDIHPANMLFENGELTGYIDFEITTVGPRVFDPCYCATSVLVGGFNDASQNARWPIFLYDILAAYDKSSNLTKEELLGAEYMLYMIQLTFLAFMCTQGNLDAARYNESVLYWLFDNRDTIRSHQSTIAAYRVSHQSPFSITMDN